MSIGWAGRFCFWNANYHPIWRCGLVWYNSARTPFDMNRHLLLATEQIAPPQALDVRIVKHET